MTRRGPAAALAALALATLLAPAAARAQADAGPGPADAPAESPAPSPADAGAGELDAATLPATAEGDRSVAAAVEPSSVPLGGRVRYTVTVRHARGDRVQLPPRGTNVFGPCRSLGQPQLGSRDEGTRVADTFVFELVALEVTKDGLPPFPVSLVSPDGRAYQLAAAPVPLEIVDPTANEPLADVKPRGAKGADGKVDPVRPYVVYVRDWTLAWVLGILGGVLLVALLAVLVTRWWMRRRQPAVPVGPPPVPPYPAARERLARLRLEGVYGRMGAKAFHVELAEAVREYLGRRHDLEALEMTSEELIEGLARKPMGGITGLELEQFLAACDFVKFAKAEPNEREALDELGTGDRIVEQVERAMVDVELRRAAEEAARAAVAAAAAAAAAEAAAAAKLAPSTPGAPPTIPTPPAEPPQAPLAPPAEPPQAPLAPSAPAAPAPPSEPGTPPEVPR
jgi:hypothetical protein